jgi:hypothetical protein
LRSPVGESAGSEFVARPYWPASVVGTEFRRGEGGVLVASD